MINSTLYLLTYKGSVDGYGAETEGSVYNLVNACSNCGTGAKLISDLIIKDFKGKKDLFSTYDGDYLISFKLLELLQAKSNLLNSLANVVSKGGLNELPYKVLTSDFILPAVRKDSVGLKTENQCLVCKRDGHFSAVVGVVQR